MLQNSVIYWVLTNILDNTEFEAVCFSVTSLRTILHDRVNHHLICHQCENLKYFVGCFLTGESNSC